MFFKQLPQVFNKQASSNNSLIISEANQDLRYILAILAFNAQNKDSVIICNSIEEAVHVFNLASNIFKLNNVYLFPDFNLDPYSKASSSNYLSSTRINTLYALINNPQPKLVITTPLGFLHKTTAKSYLQNKQLKLTINDAINIKEVISFLGILGYIKVDTVSSPKTFALRGDILDIFAANELPYRISFFDNTVESIKTFNYENQRTVESVLELNIQLPSELVFNDEAAEYFKYEYQIRFGSFAKNDLNLQALNSNILPSGAEHYLPLLVEQTAFLYEYLANDTSFILLVNVEEKFKQIWHNYSDAKLVRNNNQAIKTEHVYYVLPVEDLLLKQEVANTVINGSYTINITSNKIPEEISVLNNKAVNVISANSKDISYLFNLKSTLNEKCNILANYLSEAKSNTVILNFNTSSLIKLLTEALNSKNLKFNNINNLENIKLNKINIINHQDLVNGFYSESLIIICEADLLSNTKIASNYSRKKAKNAFKSVSNIAANELVVHIKHGVGKFIGLTTLNMGGISHDFLLIEYKDQDKLYVPVENIDLVGRYGSSEVELDRLGGHAWEKKQAKVKEKLKDIAYDLIKLAATRNVNKGPLVNFDLNTYTEFVTKFPYIETDDQLSAINDIENDFKAEKIMDRLICGDVGFGKTEIAMRAAFLAVSSGFQVAIITPTTLLCRQHYYNFVERFKGFNINIKQLSKFVTGSAKKEIKADLEAGKVDIVIGTHALLAKDIKFKNLGLLIIDEEQNFGVVHKEQLKALRDNVHVLTLTATPIPRTLQLALTKVKDLSIIATPPINKLSIQTYVMPSDQLIIKEAITREILRGGQVFYVTPYIKDIDALEILLKDLNPEWRMLTIHGALSADQIEKGMEQFQNHHFDILLSTNIIESGIDIRNVNTIIINNSDKFGLSQLYQLRGRVGRGENQAFAYITYKSQTLLTEAAEKRLLAIQNLDYLGAGFSLAEQDLDIRGAGNILGEEQSGHIKEIGFDLYQKFLAAEIEKAKHQNGTKVSLDSLSPNISLNIPALIPSYYVPDILVRMDIYGRLGNCNNLLEVEDIIDELIDRFGKIPLETLNLITTIKLKNLCKNIGIEKISCGPKAALLNFFNNKVNNFEGLIEYIGRGKGIIKIKPDSSIIINFISEAKDLQIKQLFAIINELKQIVI